MTIIYDKTKSEFLQDIFGIKPIEDLLEQIIYKKMKRVTNINEKRARKAMTKQLTYSS